MIWKFYLWQISTKFLKLFELSNNFSSFITISNCLKHFYLSHLPSQYSSLSTFPQLSIFSQHYSVFITPDLISSLLLISWNVLFFLRFVTFCRIFSFYAAFFNLFSNLFSCLTVSHIFWSFFTHFSSLSSSPFSNSVTLTHISHFATLSLLYYIVTNYIYIYIFFSFTSLLSLQLTLSYQAHLISHISQVSHFYYFFTFFHIFLHFIRFPYSSSCFLIMLFYGVTFSHFIDFFYFFPSPLLLCLMFSLKFPISY